MKSPAYLKMDAHWAFIKTCGALGKIGTKAHVVGVKLLITPWGTDTCVVLVKGVWAQPTWVSIRYFIQGKY